MYLTIIQKFSEDIGLLSDRENIICISDEAHITQTGAGAKLKKTEDGIFISYGFAKHLRESFPNATFLSKICSINLICIIIYMRSHWKDLCF